MFNEARQFPAKLKDKHEKAMKNGRSGPRNAPVAEDCEQNHRELAWLYGALNERSRSIAIVNICGGQTSKAKNSKSRIVLMTWETWVAFRFRVWVSILEEQQKPISGGVHEASSPKN
jgi:hypothetical protein